MAKLPISATIVARNEELKIENCLKSLAAVDEVIFIHDGRCDDATLIIARRYTNKLFSRDYVGEAEPHRRFALLQAKHNWILQIDADEFLTPGLIKAIPGLIKDKTVSGYRFKWNVSYTDEKPRYNPKLVLYRKDRINSFRGIPHEVVSLNGRTKTIDNIELGHDRTRSALKSMHNTQEWPKIHGKYLERHKFRNLPNILLPLGFFFYPLLGTLISILRGTISFREIPGCFDYHHRLWHSFCEHRLKKQCGGK